jgi:hypothetical protein
MRALHAFSPCVGADCAKGLSSAQSAGSWNLWQSTAARWLCLLKNEMQLPIFFYQLLGTFRVFFLAHHLLEKRIVRVGNFVHRVSFALILARD